MSKLTGLHYIFRKNSIYGANMGFHALMFARSLGRWRCLKPRTTALVVIQGHLISQLYMDEMLRSVVLPFLCENQQHYHWLRMTMPEHTSLESAKNNVVHISLIRHVYNFNMFRQRVQSILIASRNPQPLDTVLQNISMLIPQHQISRIIQSMRNRC